MSFSLQRAAPSEKQAALRARLNNNNDNTWTAVHLLSAEEVLGIFWWHRSWARVFGAHNLPSQSGCAMLTILGKCSAIERPAS